MFFFLIMQAQAQLSLKQVQAPLVYDLNGEPWPNALAGGIHAAQFNTFDFDGDGIEDLLVFDRMANRPKVFLWKDGQWIYSPASAYLLPGTLRNWVRMVDMDCDGEKDLLTSTLLGIRVYKTSRDEQGNPIFNLAQNPLLTEGASGMINLQVSATDIPFIGDVDGDGLPDVLTYTFAAGGFVEFHKNVSTENGGDCGQMLFRRESRSWGDFEECDCNAFAFAGEDCGTLSNARVEHAGGKSLHLFDLSGDGLLDILGGHELCPELYFLPNSGSAKEALFRSFVSGFPADRPVLDMPFSAAYSLDVDKDGRLDLLVSSNLPFNLLDGLDVQRSMRYYRNTGTAVQPEYTWQQDDFLQNTMFDVGENAFPAAFDPSAEGHLDLLVGQRGLQTSEGFVAGITHLQANQEGYWQVVEEDFLSLKQYGFSNLKPQLADVNGDAVPDLVFSATRSGSTRLYWLQGQRNNGRLHFEGGEPREIGFTLSLNDNAYLFDLDEDGLTDILLARANGQLDYFQNQGESGFVLVQERFAGIDRSTSATNLSITLGDFTRDGRVDMITSDFSGAISFYSDVLGANPEPIRNLLKVKGNLIPSRLSQRSFVHAMSGQNGFLLWVGSSSGGLQLFEMELSVTAISSPPADLPKVQAWPNPFSTAVFIKSPTDAQAILIDMHARTLRRDILLKAREEEYLDLLELPAGLYILRLRHADGSSESLRLWKK